MLKNVLNRKQTLLSRMTKLTYGLGASGLSHNVSKFTFDHRVTQRAGIVNGYLWRLCDTHIDDRDICISPYSAWDFIVRLTRRDC